MTRKPWDGTLCPRYPKLDKRWTNAVHTHPSANCYQSHRCRCPDCLAAFKRRKAELAEGIEVTG